MTAFILAMIATMVISPATQEDTYSVWSEDIHLIMCDNGTPDDYDDDWVVDWETNRIVNIDIID